MLKPIKPTFVLITYRWQFHSIFKRNYSGDLYSIIPHKFEKLLAVSYRISKHSFCRWQHPHLIILKSIISQLPANNSCLTKTSKHSLFHKYQIINPLNYHYLHLNQTTTPYFFLLYFFPSTSYMPTKHEQNLPRLSIFASNFQSYYI